MSTEIFKWMPKLVESGRSGTGFNTLKVVYDNGMSQRRNRFGREVGMWQFEYDFRVYSPDTAKKLKDEIIDFFRDRQGSYDNFYLPSWELEAQISSSAAGNTGFSIDTSASDMGFSATAGDPGNFAYLCNHYYKSPGDSGQVHEVVRLNTIGGTGNKSLVAAAALSNTYAAGAKIMKAAKVTFTEDELMREWQNPYAYNLSLSFVEDIADLY